MIRHSHSDYDIHFLGKETSSDDLRRKFPNACLMQQVHGDHLVDATIHVQTADAQWSDNGQLSLVVQTADCLPVMLYLPRRDIIIGIHAGWRGVQQKIVSKALQQMHVEKGDPVHVFIGPHIQKESFEVDLDVASEILQAHGPDVPPDICEKRGDKYHLDLSALVLREILSLKMNIDAQFISDIDTKIHPDYYSYRAGDRGGRNYSVINKKSAR